MNWRLPNQHRTFSEDGALFTVCDHCGNECVPDSPCRCCEKARADEAEAECNALSARLIKAVPASYVAMKERALRAEAALERVREVVPESSPCARKIGYGLLGVEPVVSNTNDGHLQRCACCYYARQALDGGTS